MAISETRGTLDGIDGARLHLPHPHLPHLHIPHPDLHPLGHGISGAWHALGAAATFGPAPAPTDPRPMRCVYLENAEMSRMMDHL